MTICEFYDAILLPKIICVSPELPLVPVVVQFGKYLKIIVVLEDNEVEPISSKTRNKLHVGKYHHLFRSELHTHLLSYCEKQEVLWKPDEINTNRGCPIPDVFDQFQGFNTPHLLKHRKHTTSNMTCNGLEALSSKLYGVLQSSFLHRPSWIEMKANLEILAHSLNKYSNLLREKSKVMKRVHDSTEPWRS